MHCFVIMPFASEFDEVYRTIRKAVEEGTAGKVACHRLDELKTPGRITDDLVEAIADADFCIADLTGMNPNVMWEVGYAMALTKPVLFLSQSVDSLPFDLRNMRVLAYGGGQADPELHADLLDAVRATLGAATSGSGPQKWQPARRIVAEGSAAPLRLIGDDDEVFEIKPGRWRQDLSGFEILTRHERVQINAGYRLSDGEELIMEGNLRGNGIMEAGRAYIAYRVTDSAGVQGIAGILKLVLPQGGPITGYYLAESYSKAARTVLGTVMLRRVRPGAAPQ